ncbi:hypothetical protein B0H13DRAFT_1859269 [Mycena leptocephala]|nr:hypothetical protein B0H13DRAFT_1859269 [Mycena leptocephala]
MTLHVSVRSEDVEFGSYDPGLSVFIPMQSLGSINETSCVVGFDQTSFILGSTADVFPEFNASSHLELNDPSGLQFSTRVQKIIPQSNNVRLDGAIVPNAFHGRAGFSEAHEKLLTLADGGLDGANIPLQPLLVKARGIQAIITHDATADKKDNFLSPPILCQFPTSGARCSSLISGFSLGMQGSLYLESFSVNLP